MGPHGCSAPLHSFQYSYSRLKIENWIFWSDQHSYMRVRTPVIAGQSLGLRWEASSRWCRVLTCLFRTVPGDGGTGRRHGLATTGTIGTTSMTSFRSRIRNICLYVEQQLSRVGELLNVRRLQHRIRSFSS